MKYNLLCAGLLAAITSTAQNPVRIELVPWAEGLGPITDIASAGDSRLFVANQDGLIWVVTDSMTVLPTPFLDLSGSVQSGLEMGLLGLVFDPDHANNGLFYVHYVGTGANPPNRVSRFHISPDPNVADASSGEVIYSGPPVGAAFHRGGDLDFGLDGMLYISLGDGFNSSNAQDLSDPLGDIVRIDVSDTTTTYSIPPDNPYANAGVDTLPEIWASGLRNPFRFGFDRLTGDLWIGDVGEGSWEEIDFLPAADNSGPNFGWPCYEANAIEDTAGCLPFPSYAAPAITQAHNWNGGSFCAIIGGRVYRGVTWPHLYGRYFYTDYCPGEFHDLRPDGMGGWIDEVTLDAAASGYSCIAENAEGELFAGNGIDAMLYKIIDHCPMDPPTILQNGSTLESSIANAYQWFFDGDSVPSATSLQYLPTASGNVHVVADYGNGCVLSSDTLSFILAGVGELGNTALSLGPVPVSDELVVRVHGSLPHNLRVMDASGRAVLSARWTTVEQHVSTLGLAAGQYILQAVDANGAVMTAQRFSVVR